VGIRPIIAAMRRNLLGPVLLMLQVALTLTIVSNALQVVVDHVALSQRPTGIDDEQRVGVLAYWPGIQNIKDDRARDLEILRGNPDVQSFSLSTQVPLINTGWNGNYALSPGATKETISLATYYADQGLIPTLGLQLIDGRNFTADEISSADPDQQLPQPAQAIITETVAHTLFPNLRTAVGQVLYPTDSDAPIRIIGVIRSLQSPWGSSGARGEYSMILPRHQPASLYVIRTAPGHLDATLKALSGKMRAADPDRLEWQNLSLTDARRQRYAATLGSAWLLVGVSAFLLVVTAAGIVGMASLWVSQRRRQIGVRRALGATRGDILSYFLTENLLITGAGAMLGVFAALVLNRALMKALSLQALPPQTLAAGAVLVVLLGLCAAFGPALRAARIAPGLATRA